MAAMLVHMQSRGKPCPQRSAHRRFLLSTVLGVALSASTASALNQMTAPLGPMTIRSMPSGHEVLRRQGKNGSSTVALVDAAGAEQPSIESSVGHREKRSSVHSDVRGSKVRQLTERSKERLNARTETSERPRKTRFGHSKPRKSHSIRHVHRVLQDQFATFAFSERIKGIALLRENRTESDDKIPDAQEPEEETEEEFSELEHQLWMAFFSTTPLSEWILFLMFVLFFLGNYYTFFTSEFKATTYPGIAILCWFGMAALYAYIVFARLGEEAMSIWVDGYVLELVFSLENVFVFHVIIESFSVPKNCVQMVLFWLVCLQICFGLLLYMGLADIIVRCEALPYILGLWLTYLGISSACEGSSEAADFDILEHRVVRCVRWLLGDRLVLKFEGGKLVGSSEDGTFYLTMLGLVLICLLLADLFLEVDVTLTKIEKFHDPYLAFTSSALAGFAVPELFFISQWLFRVFPHVIYGISFVLVFFGVQMLLPGILNISPMDSCAIIGIVMLVCIIVSLLSTLLLPWKKKSQMLSPGGISEAIIRKK
eukprot:TRINITY_DN13746_c0_g1_i2.p1 TRINITY_DN13746_c0_g1~~TRINITY_DN13746_c0_g1_i2.p1  ORF type:complete len:541 (+),score=63.01 TRINITY_DN13746_c0_g1_i2:57-1679(+)